MEIKTTIDILEENQYAYDELQELGGIVEKYENEFGETFYKKWLSVESLIKKPVIYFFPSVVCICLTTFLLAMYYF